MLEVIILKDSGIVPVKAHDGDAGYDLFSAEDVVIPAKSTVKIPLGIGIDVPYGSFGDVTGKSGLTSSTDIRIERGIVDNGYHGEVSVITTNISHEAIIIKRGMKFAQVILSPCDPEKEVRVKDRFHNENGRGDGGFGSTGMTIGEAYEKMEERMKKSLQDKANGFQD